MHKRRNAYNILVGKLGGNRPFRRPMLRWKGNIRTDLRGKECEGVD
jgi:hypothetical protein